MHHINWLWKLCSLFYLNILFEVQLIYSDSGVKQSVYWMCVWLNALFVYIYMYTECLYYCICILNIYTFWMYIPNIYIVYIYMYIECMYDCICMSQVAIIFFRLFSTLGYYKILTIVPYLHNRFLLCFIYSSVCMLTPNSKFILPPQWVSFLSVSLFLLCK